VARDNPAALNLRSQIVTSNSIPPERVERRILLIRGQKVMLDEDLAELYEIDTKTLNRAVSRNVERFPEDFMFQLTAEESRTLRYQIGTSNEGRGGRRYRPYAFTEQGVAMLSSVLRSPRAVQVNIAIMRAFVKLREILSTHHDLASRLDELESRYDEQFRAVFDAIRELMRPPEKPSRRIGFTAPKSD
jgi:phage regulator Rha-like protein